MRFAVVGLDSPHAPEFVQIFTSHPELGEVVGAVRVPPSRDFSRSVDRAATFAEEVVALGAAVVDAAADLSGTPDAFLVTAVDPRRHPSILKELLGFGRPVFVHTRLVMNEAQAREAFECADAAGAVLDVASPKRFAPGFASVLASGPVDGVVLRGPAPREWPLPPFHWYGVHLVDLAIALMGPGVSSASVADLSADAFRVELKWRDGREAALDCTTKPSVPVSGWAVRRGRREDFAFVTDEAAHLALLRSIVHATARRGVLTQRESAIEIVRVTDLVSKAMAAL